MMPTLGDVIEISEAKTPGGVACEREVLRRLWTVEYGNESGPTAIPVVVARSLTQPKRQAVGPK